MTLILSLDDDPVILQLIGLPLALAGYEHQRFTNSHEALAALRTEMVDLFTQDCLRPDIRGLDLYRLLKSDQDLRHIPVLFISAVHQPEFAAECRTVFGDDYLNKPFTPQELLTAVTAMLRRHNRHVPTEEERAARYEHIRDDLKNELGAWMDLSTERLDALYEKLSSFLTQIDRVPES